MRGVVVEALVDATARPGFWLEMADLPGTLEVENAILSHHALPLLIQLLLRTTIGLLVRLNQQQSGADLNAFAARHRTRRPVTPGRHRAVSVGNLHVGDRALGLHTLLLLDYARVFD